MHGFKCVVVLCGVEIWAMSLLEVALCRFRYLYLGGV